MELNIHLRGFKMVKAWCVRLSVSLKEQSNVFYFIEILNWQLVQYMCLQWHSRGKGFAPPTPHWLGETFIGVPGYWQFSYVGTCHDSLIETSHLVAGSSKSRRVNNTHISSLFLCFLRNAHTHIQIMNPSKISRAIHWSGLRAEWMHSSHNYCGGSHTLHQSIPVSKSPGENSEYVRFLKDIMRFLYLHLRKVKRGERDLQSIKVTSWLIHMSEPRTCSWKRRIQWLQMLTWSERWINLWKNNKKNNLYHPRYIFKNITVFLTREDKCQFREALVWNRRGRESRKRQRCL